MSSTIMNVAIPDMSQHFTLGQSRVQWVTSGFMVAMTVSMLTTPWLLSRYGYRRVYEVCMWLLLGGGVVGGLANDFPLVMAARVAEGLAAGVVQPRTAEIHYVDMRYSNGFSIGWRGHVAAPGGDGQSDV